MSTRSLSELVRRVVRKAQEETRVSMPARVVSYDPGTRLARVQILQPEVTDAGQVVQQPVVTDIPVFMPFGGGASITMPIKSGDEGVMWFADQDIGAWAGDGVTVPDSSRRHSLSDGMFMPSQGRGAADADNFVISFGGATITIDPGGKVTIDAPAGLEVIGPSVKHNGTEIGDTHVHGGVVVGASNTEEPV